MWVFPKATEFDKDPGSGPSDPLVLCFSPHHSDSHDKAHTRALKSQITTPDMV